MQVVKSFRSFGATIHVLANGQAVRVSITGAMLLTEVGGEIVSLHDTLEEALVRATEDELIRKANAR